LAALLFGEAGWAALLLDCMRVTWAACSVAGWATIQLLRGEAC
jgi:hypothetical protein